jgi:DNA-directed RNA polymerase subunit RPC12/RpoP
VEKKFDSMKFFEDLRNGKKVKCLDCKDGFYVTDYDPKTTPGFHCDKCGSKVNIN